jgi:hypothetical protein
MPYSVTDLAVGVSDGRLETASARFGSGHRWWPGLRASNNNTEGQFDGLHA